MYVLRFWKLNFNDGYKKLNNMFNAMPFMGNGMVCSKKINPRKFLLHGLNLMFRTSGSGYILWWTSGTVRTCFSRNEWKKKKHAAIITHRDRIRTWRTNGLKFLGSGLWCSILGATVRQEKLQKLQITKISDLLSVRRHNSTFCLKVQFLWIL